MSKLDDIAEGLGEFAHQQYLGYTQNKAAKDGYEYAYENEVVNMAHQYFENEGKQMVKDVMLELIGEDKMIINTKSATHAHFVTSKNELRAELRKKIEEL